VIDTPFAVINADDFYGQSSYQVLGDYLQRAQDRDGVYDYCIVGFVLRNTLTEHGHVARGVCRVDGAGRLVGIRELTRIEKSGNDARYTEDGTTWAELPDESVVSMNMWGFTPGLFAELEARFLPFLQESDSNILGAECFLPVAVGKLVAEGKATVQVLPSDEQWFGVTYKQNKSRVKRAIQNLVSQGVYPDDLWLTYAGPQ
jgi:hypothetical protein